MTCPENLKQHSKHSKLPKQVAPVNRSYTFSALSSKNGEVEAALWELHDPRFVNYPDPLTFYPDPLM